MMTTGPSLGRSWCMIGHHSSSSCRSLCHLCHPYAHHLLLRYGDLMQEIVSFQTYKYLGLCLQVPSWGTCLPYPPYSAGQSNTVKF